MARKGLARIVAASWVAAAGRITADGRLVAGSLGAAAGRAAAGIITAMRCFAWAWFAAAWVAAAWVASAGGPAWGQDATGLGGIGEASAQPKITNPFYRTPAWRLWTENDMPVTIRDERDGKRRRVILAPLPPEKRKYPNFDDPKAPGLPSLRTADSPPEQAGWWDDVAMTMDNGHSNVPKVGSGIRLGDQFMRVPFGYPFHPKHRLPLGCTFTTESLACRGRHIVDDQNNMRNTEQFFFFANTVRGTPGHASYNDNDPNRSHDDYDGLFGHQYQSIGQSSSEKHGVYKMLVAGGCMPRTTKDLLKLHGAFAPPLIAAWRASLPFVDEAGEEVPYANELRHRPVYSSRGTITHVHYSMADPYYHAYDEQLHIRRMIDFTRRMDVPPPVAVMKMSSLAVHAPDAGSPRLVLNREDWHVKSTALTSIRLWARPGETLEATIDLTNSYDLTGRAIEYHAARVYPNQTNVLIEGVRPGVYKVTVRPDANLPKMRMPVVFHATNGTDLPSNPVFLNVHYPVEGEPSDFVPRGGARRSPVPVNDNRRPIPRIAWPYNTAVAAPGETVSVALDATDPEGFDVRRYRWSSEEGRLVDGRYELWVEPNRPPCVIPAHVVFSDGTGAYKGELLRVIVAGRRPSLPEGYHLSTVGIPASAGEVSTDGQRVSVKGVGGRILGKRAVGTVLARPMRGDFELACEVESVSRTGNAQGPAVAGLFARASLYEHAYFGMVGVEARGEEMVARWRGRNGGWSGSKAEGRKGATRLRLIRRGELVAGLTSTDGKDWRQLCHDEYEFGQACDAGVTVFLDDAHREDRPSSADATVRLLPPGEPVAIARVVGQGKGRPKDRSHVMAPTKLTVYPPAGMTVRYTIDDEAPSPDSPAYDEPIVVKQAGSHEVRLRAFEGGRPTGPVVTVPFTAE